MADIVFYSSVLELDGEIKLTKQVLHSKLNSATLQIDVRIHKPDDTPYTDPTLTVFHEPKSKDKH